MKNLIAMLLFIALTISCKEAKKFEVGQTKDDTYLKATIDGEVLYVEKPINDFISTKKIISLFAKDEDKNEKIRMVITYNNGPSTYTLGKDQKNLFVYGNNKVDWAAVGSRGEGSVTISEEGSYLIGKFSFTGYNPEGNPKKVTDGEFRVKNKAK